MGGGVINELGITFFSVSIILHILYFNYVHLKNFVNRFIVSLRGGGEWILGHAEKPIASPQPAHKTHLA